MNRFLSVWTKLQLLFVSWRGLFKEKKKRRQTFIRRSLDFVLSFLVWKREFISGGKVFSKDFTFFWYMEYFLTGRFLSLISLRPFTNSYYLVDGYRCAFLVLIFLSTNLLNLPILNFLSLQNRFIKTDTFNDTDFLYEQKNLNSQWCGIIM